MCVPVWQSASKPAPHDQTPKHPPPSSYCFIDIRRPTHPHAHQTKCHLFSHQPDTRIDRGWEQIFCKEKRNPPSFRAAMTSHPKRSANPGLPQAAATNSHPHHDGHDLTTSVRIEKVFLCDLPDNSPPGVLPSLFWISWKSSLPHPLVLFRRLSVI